MNIHLLLYEILFSFSLILNIFLILFVFFKAKKGTAKITLLLILSGAFIFVLSQILGVLVIDGELSRKILSIKLIVFFFPVLSAHAVFASIKRQKEYKNTLILFYAIASNLFIFFILNPRYFFTTSVPKLYFPNYYEAGPYCFIMLIFLFFIATVFGLIIRKIYKASNNIDKNRIKYFAIAWFFGYFFGFMDFPLIYNIHFIDPIWGFLSMPLFATLFTYAALEYELMDIKLIAKNAFIYSFISATICFILILLNYVNNLIIQSSPGFPNWISSLILALIATIMVFFIWKKIKEEDLLKYEFINVAIHKFRTPLTTIKWSSEGLTAENLEESKGCIKKSTNRLVDLTNLLVNLSITDEKAFEYKLIMIDLNDLIKNLLLEYSEEISEKGIKLLFTSIDSINYVLADEQKLKFVFRTLLDNAINYNRQGGFISVDILNQNNKNIIIEIKDAGIGISKEEIGLIFTKFYRTENSKRADTEGMGIGLYLTKKILEKLNGKIWVKSEGAEKGSSFFVSLPKKK